MIKTITLLLTATVSLLVGCSKESHVSNPSAPIKVVAPDSLTDWGVVEFSESIPQHLKLNDGRDCTLTATSLSGGKLQIVIKTDGKTAAGDQAPLGAPVFPVGTPTHVSSTRIIPSGGTISGYVDNRLVSFTAKLKTP